MAFQFRLEKVARYRRNLVDERGREVAEVNRIVAGLKAQIEAVNTDISRHLQDFSDEAAPVVSVQGMMSRTMWVSHLEEMREEFSEELIQANEELNQRRERLNEAWRDLEILNKLREKQEAAWRDEQFKRENQDLDEIGRIRAERQRRSKVAS